MGKRTIYSEFRKQVDAHPDIIAIQTDKESITFRELDRLSALLAQGLIKEQHKRIGIVMQHGVRQVAAMLAVLRSGASYIPAEPSLPQNRIDYMMETAEVRLIMTDQYVDNQLSCICDAEDVKDLSERDGEAYILFTSGTTGRPKGVIVENHSVVNYATAFRKEMRVGLGDVMLQYSICSFDIFVEEVFVSLLNGVALAIPNASVHNGPLSGLMDFCMRHKVTILDGFPYLIADLNRQPHLIPDSVRLIISGGDVVRASYISALRKRGIRIYNTYGPSETTVCSNYYRIDNATPLDDGTFPIGKAIQGVTVHLFDDNLHPISKSEVGEICISGEGVSRGYLGDPPEQANFVTLDDGTRLYRSGDLGYELEDGNIVFLHRKDDQVMILGRRVEPDEVENILNSYPGIERGVVRALKEADGPLSFLVAYIVPADGFCLSDLKQYMRSRLADFMIPEYFVSLTSIPITPRGKVDTRALPVILKDATYR